MLPCVKPGDADYDKDRVISNARFDLKPSSICYCENEDDVREALGRATPGKARVRSGGHQHEGMCSGDDVTMIDVSKINSIEIATAKGQSMLVGAGARLSDVYKKLWSQRRLLPGGGCGDVCVGGLVQGGGWGPYSRKLGLTCDRLRGFDIVLADGRILEVTNAEDDPHERLFWAVAGGGGGNFGVITRFRFDVEPLTTPIISFTVSWFDRNLTGDVIEEWRNRFPGDADDRLTSFCRLTVLAGGASTDPPIVVAGFFLGEKAELERILAAMLPSTFGSATVTYDRVDTDAAAFQHPAYQPGPPGAAAADVGGDLTSTCDGHPFPHKVSSCYPRTTFDGASVQAIVDYLHGSEREPTARRYLSLHSMGGAIGQANDRSCFAYRDKPFLLQYQAWWANKEQKDVEKRCIDWVVGFRETMRPCTEGSFINFPDRDIALNEYYRQNFGELINIKRYYDPGNFFKFEMGIPTS